VAESIEWLWELTGGFGSLLILENSAASPAARRASYQLFAREVAPRFTGELDQLLASQRRAVVAREEGYARRIAAQEKAYAKLTDRAGAGE
jgi:limonene 1,2-monooxygenase